VTGYSPAHITREEKLKELINTIIMMMCTDKSFRINTGYSSQKKFRFHDDFKVKRTHTQVMSYPSHTHTHTLLTTHTHTLLTRANPACFSVCVCHFLLSHPHSLLMFPSGGCVCVCVCSSPPLFIMRSRSCSCVCYIPLLFRIFSC